jgi:myo-inositol-1(or 4)-monophosphatase
MILEDHSPHELLDLAILAAHDAGNLIASVSRFDLNASTKSSPTDLVTQMDAASERLIRQIILKSRPGDGIIGEEETSIASRSGVNWLVDPIDGTTNYLRGIPNYSISIAAIKDGKTLTGVVHDPTMNETFTAVDGEGAALNGVRIHCSATVFPESIIGTGFSYSSGKRVRQADILRAILPSVGDIRRPGSAAVSLCWVACGRLDAFYERGLQPWDYAAGAFIASEAGADLLVSEQDHMRDRLVVASAPSVTTQLREILKAA